MAIGLAPSAAVAFVEACSSTSSQSGGTKTIDIAQISPSTGPYAIYGIAVKTAWKLKAAEINGQGGIKIGNDLYKVNLHPFDDQLNDTLSRTIGEQEAAAGIKFFSMDGSPGPDAQEALSTQNKIIVIHTSTDETTYKAPYMVGTINPEWTTYGAQLKAIKQQFPSAVHVSAIAPNLAEDYDLRDRVPSVVQKLNNGLVYDGVVFGTIGQDWSPVVTKVLSQRPDIVILGCLASDQVAGVTLLRDLGYKGIIDGGRCQDLSDDQFIKAIGADYLEGNYFRRSNSPSQYPAGMQAYHDAFTATGATWLDFAIGYWYGPELFFAALQAAGTVDNPDAIMTALRKTKVKVTLLDGAPEVGVVGADAYGTNSILENFVFVDQFKGGKFVSGPPLLPTF
jgi:branched-chain amino acid transport system substrate-binding protein